MFDPCGTRKLEGEELIKRLAEVLGIDKNELEAALRCLVRSYKTGLEKYPELDKAK